MKFFGNINSLEELKKEYKRLVRVYHPDLGGNPEMMKVLNAEYDEILQSQRFQKYFNSESCKTSPDIEKSMREIIERLIVIQGITIEVCGTWLWITGDTYPVKDKLKNAGCWFASKKKAWYWRPADQKSKNKKPYTMNEIRQIHGSRIVEKQENYALS